MLTRLFSPALLFALIVVADISGACPDGFAVYSKGDNINRTLYKVSLSSITGVGQEVKICEKGAAGGDIQGQISFDGTMVAFARSLGGNPGDYGGDDYHAFGGWDIYVVKIDGALPATPVRVAHGYYPSWGANSSEDVKTLYYSVHEMGQIWKATINSNGSVSDTSFHATAGGSFMMCSPDGQNYAFRSGTNMYIKNFQTGNSFLAGGGCHPHWTADGKWMVHASGHAVRNDGSRDVWIHTIVGPYHYGSSQDMAWFINTTNATAGTQNNGGTLYLYTLDAADDRFNLSRQNELITADGSWPDIHAGRVDQTPVNTSRAADGSPSCNHRAYRTPFVNVRGNSVVLTPPFAGAYRAEVLNLRGQVMARLAGSASSP